MCKTETMQSLPSTILFYTVLLVVEKVRLSNGILNSLTHSWHAVFWKLFGTNDVDCISDIRRFVSYLPLATEIDTRRVVSLYRTSCKYPSSGRSSLGPCVPLSTVFIALLARSILSALRASVNDIDHDLYLD